jgi:energy-coupling factor transporter ATP-binding protein EcfA2
MIMLIPSRFRVSQLVAITSPARPKYACRRSRPAVAVRPLSTKFLHDTRTFGIAGVAAGFGIMNPHDHIIIGERNSWGDPVTFGISPTDRRQHLYVIGKTGSGKTTLLRNLIVQHIAAGHGVGLIDPHGDLAEELLDHIPPARTDDLVYFHPGDLGFPVGLNLFANVLPDDRHLVASGIVGAFKSIWRDSWGPRLEYILYNAIAALLDCENMTLLGVNRLLTDPAFRSRIVLRIRDPFIRDFWENEFASYDPRFQREAIAPIQNKLGQFLLNPVVRNILGQVKSRVSIPFVMNNERLFIANLAKGRLGHDKANLLGSLLTTQFQLAAMARTNQPENERRDFYLFIDEFQNFSTDAFASILAEARKYRLCLVLSHQYVDQLSLPVRQAVFGNVGTLIAFRIGNTDAEVLQAEFGNEFAAQQLVDLERYEVIIKLLANGTNTQPFRGKTLPPLENRVGRRENLISRSRERFASPRAVVENKLNRWLESSN